MTLCATTFTGDSARATRTTDASRSCIGALTPPRPPLVETSGWLGCRDLAPTSNVSASDGILFLMQREGRRVLLDPRLGTEPRIAPTKRVYQEGEQITVEWDAVAHDLGHLGLVDSRSGEALVARRGEPALTAHRVTLVIGLPTPLPSG